MIMVNFNAKTGKITMEEIPDVERPIIELNTIPEPTPEERIADLEAEITKLKQELNVQ